jgi:ATP adenylyltransferase
MEYILGEKPEECVFCLSEHGNDDRERLVLHRSTKAFVIMNKYPYNNGHLMVAPKEHIADIENIDGETALEMFQLVQRCKKIIRRSMQAEGFNIGINQGIVAGAGIREHLHIHIVPRWNGDTNFMPVLADVRTIPEHLLQTYDKLRPLFEEGE